LQALTEYKSLRVIRQGRRLHAREFVISAGEKSSIQARRRKQPTLAPASGRTTRFEHEYFREGAWTYLAARDVHRAKVFGRCETKAAFPRLHLRVRPLEPFCVYVQGTQFEAKVNGVTDWCACARQQLARLSSAMFHCAASTILFWFAWRCARCEQKPL